MTSCLKLLCTVLTGARWDSVTDRNVAGSLELFIDIIFPPLYSRGFDSASNSFQYKKYLVRETVCVCVFAERRGEVGVWRRYLRKTDKLQPYQLYVPLHEIWESHPPRTLRACVELYSHCFNYTFTFTESSSLGKGSLRLLFNWFPGHFPLAKSTSG